MPYSNPIVTETQIGAVAYLFGVTNSGSPITMIGSATILGELESDDLTLTWKEKENTDTSGNVQNIIQTNFKYERAIKFVPSAATRSLAAQLAESVIGATSDNGGAGAGGAILLTHITVANYAVGAFNGTWRVKPGTKLNLKMDDNASIDLNCERYVNNQQNTYLTNPPITG